MAQWSLERDAWLSDFATNAALPHLALVKPKPPFLPLPASDVNATTSSALPGTPHLLSPTHTATVKCQLDIGMQMSMSVP